MGIQCRHNHKITSLPSLIIARRGEVNKQGERRENMANVELKAKVNRQELDEAIEKLNELVDLLEKANSLKNELVSGEINLTVSVQS